MFYHASLSLEAGVAGYPPVDVGDLVFKHILGNFGIVKFDMPALFRAAYMSTKRLEHLLPSPETEALEFQIFAVLHMARRCQWPLARAFWSTIIYTNHERIGMAVQR